MSQAVGSIDRLAHWFVFGWVTTMLVGCLADWLVCQVCWAGCLVVALFDWFAISLLCWLFGWLFDWLICWLLDWLVGWLFWLVVWLVDWLVD